MQRLKSNLLILFRFVYLFFLYSECGFGKEKKGFSKRHLDLSLLDFGIVGTEVCLENFVQEPVIIMNDLTEVNIATRYINSSGTDNF